jgi:hypothetical protein
VFLGCVISGFSSSSFFGLWNMPSNGNFSPL